MIEIVYFFVASYSISNVFINFLQWGQISSYTIGIFLSLIITLLLMDIVAEKRRVVNASKFNFRLLQIIIVFINFAGYTSELPNAYAKDIQNALITKNKQEYSKKELCKVFSVFTKRLNHQVVNKAIYHFKNKLDF
jgi:hypothetical protein